MAGEHPLLIALLDVSCLLLPVAQSSELYKSVGLSNPLSRKELSLPLGEGMKVSQDASKRCWTRLQGVLAWESPAHEPHK